MNKKTNIIWRFLTLLFTDKDITEKDHDNHSSELNKPNPNTTKEFDFYEENALPDFLTDEIQDPYDDKTTLPPDKESEKIEKEMQEVPIMNFDEELLMWSPEQHKEEEIKRQDQTADDPKEEIVYQIKPQYIGEEKESVRTFVIPEAPKPRPKTISQKPNTETDKKVDTITLGLTEDGNDTINIDTEALNRHMLVIGMTGSGKTTLLERMILQDIEAGRGVGLIDPHGDLYEKIIHQIPKSRSNDVVLFDLTDSEYPIGFNILDNSQKQFPSLIASSLVGVFKKIFGYSWGPRLEYILRNATLTLLEHDGGTLFDLTMLLTDENFRRDYLSKVKNPFLLRFWSDEFENLSLSRQAEIVSPILNKVGQFLSVPLIRNIVSQPISGFSPRWIMDNKKIFLANLSKGKIGEDVSEMLGSLLVSKFQLDVMGRANIAPEERTQFVLYVDEFQNFATESFSDIFSEARKYGLGLVIAHQYLGQVNPTLMDAILGNVANIGLFHIGSNDAKILAPNMGSGVTSVDLAEQPLYHFTLKTTKGNSNHVVHGELISPDMIHPLPGRQDPKKLQSLVREKFAKPRDFVEDKIDKKFFE